MTERSTLVNLADHILDPVATKLSDADWLKTVDRIVAVFAHLDTHDMQRDEFDGFAVAALKPVQASLGESDFAMMIKRMTGGMEGFCATDKKPTN